MSVAPGLDARVLRALRGASVHLPPGDLAGQLTVPRSAVEASLDGLRGAGFEIESHPGLGVRLLAGPDRILADDLHSRLSDCAIAREILVFQETHSTNDVAMRLGRDGHPGNVVVFAERQTGGRGRFGRKWDSQGHAGLWFSLLLRPGWPVTEWARLTTWAGIAVARAVEGFVRQPARIKWPNDVLLVGRKIAGILIESAVDGAGNLFAVVGVGVNVNQTEFPPELAEKAGSLRLASGAPVDRPAFAAALLTAMDGSYEGDGLDFAGLVEEATRRSALLGGWVSLHGGSETIEGIAESLDSDGQLQIRLPDGTLRTVMAGEVTSHIPAQGG